MFFQKLPWCAILAFPAIFLLACASPKSPTGGPEDMLPPVIIEAESTPNRQTQFKENEITITFDEWFTMKDINSQLVVSPLMPQQPEVKQKGKSIIINLPDSLREETTYTINFGSSIADLNEGNVLENFAFVFSTGDVLDSVKMSGIVTNAVTLTPAEGAWVMLYPAGEDSAVYKRKPEYVAKTNKQGLWSMSNIRADSFDVVALKDDNLNFLYDQETELFGWIDYPIYTYVSDARLPDIRVFPREKRIGIRDIIHAMPGWIKIIVDAPAPKPVPEITPTLEGAATAWDGDTLHIWYGPERNYSGEAILNQDTSKIREATDTRSDPSGIRIGVISGRVHPQASAQFSMSVPFSSLDTSKITLVHDSLGVMPYTLLSDSINRRLISVAAGWKPNARHTVTFLPGAVRDVWGRVNDTVRHSIVANSADQFGDLTLNIEGLDSTKSYLVLVKTGEQIVTRFIIDLLKATQLKKIGMAPGKYTIELIEDLNRNGAWDTGDYHTRRQPERKMIFTPDNVRAAWELETQIVWQ